MKKKFFPFIFLGTQIALVLLYIYQKSYAIQLSYQKQKYEKYKNELINKKQSLEQDLYHIKDKKNIKQYALQHLKFKQIRLTDVKKIDSTTEL